MSGTFQPGLVGGPVRAAKKAGHMAGLCVGRCRSNGDHSDPFPSRLPVRPLFRSLPETKKSWTEPR